MITVEIGNSTCKISGLSDTGIKEVTSLLSYIERKSAYFTGRPPATKRLIDKYGVFPTGLLYLVWDYLEPIHNHVEVIDNRVAPTNKQGFSFKLPFNPRPEQIAASIECCKHHRGIVSAPTGVGKSVIIGLVIATLDVKTLVVVPSLELKEQLTDSLSEWFGKDKVGIGKPIVVLNVDNKLIHEYTNYDCVIIDEFHHAAAKTYRKLNIKAWKGIYYRIGLTATPFRTDEDERLLLESVLSKVIYSLDYKTALAKGYVSQIDAFFVNVPKTVTNGLTWADVYSDLVVNNKQRNNIIASILSSLYWDKIPTICLVKEIAHGEKINAALGAASMFTVPFIKGDNSDNKQVIKSFNNKEQPVIIGTYGVLGEGVDTKPTEYVIIAGLGKSKSQFMQQVGRALRLAKGKTSAKVIIFRDISHKWTKTHFSSQVKILEEEYGVKTIAIDLL